MRYQNSCQSAPRAQPLETRTDLDPTPQLPGVRALPQRLNGRQNFLPARFLGADVDAQQKTPDTRSGVQEESATGNIRRRPGSY